MAIYKTRLITQNLNKRTVPPSRQLITENVFFQINICFKKVEILYFLV